MDITSLETQSPAKWLFVDVRLLTQEGTGQMKQFHSGCFCPWQFSCSHPCPSFVPSWNKSYFPFRTMLTTWWICQEANLTKWSGKAEGLLLSTKRCLTQECEHHSRMHFYCYMFQNYQTCSIVQNQCHTHDIDTLETNEGFGIFFQNILLVRSESFRELSC